MSITINVLAPLQKYLNGEQGIKVEGSTVGQCVNQLVEKFPAVKPALFDKDDRLYGYIQIFVNGRNAYPELMNKPVKDGDEIYLSILIGGG